MPLFSKYKFLIIYISTFFLVVFWVTIVFASDFVFSPKVEVRSLSQNIFLNDLKLKKNIISFKSNYDLSSYSLVNTCIFKSSFVWKNDENYFFDLVYKRDCLDENIYLRNSFLENVSWIKIKMNLFSEADLWSLFVDLSDSDLEKFKLNLFEETIKLQNIIKTEQKNNSYFFYELKNKRNIDENNYKTNIIDKIISSRKNLYSVPVLWYHLSTKESKVPNSPRPYREVYTFWVHEWWDIDAPVWTPVQALDDWIIVRIVSGFKFEDLQKINHKDKTLETKILNLDILRWNQVWLKTAKWDVVFYGHLDSITNDLKIWEFVSRWKYFWNIGISWVPDKNYKDSHLHFEIHKNPYILEKVWKYSFMDYMSWPWYFKWNTAKYAIEHQNEVFK